MGHETSIQGQEAGGIIRMVLKMLKKVWEWITFDEGMTWERYQKNMEKNRRERK